MIFFCSRDGTLTPYILPTLNQGSVGSESIVLLAPFSPRTTVTAAFTLPNGIRTQRQLASISSQHVLKDADGIIINAWSFENKEQDTLDITAFSGILRTQFFFTDAYRHVLSSTMCAQTVNAGVPDLPVNVSEADADAFAAYLAAARTVQEQVKENGLDAVNNALGWAAGEELSANASVTDPDLPAASVTVDLPVFASAVNYELVTYAFKKLADGRWTKDYKLADGTWAEDYTIVYLSTYGVKPPAKAVAFEVKLTTSPVVEGSQFYENNAKWYSEHPIIPDGSITLEKIAPDAASIAPTPNTLVLRSSYGSVKVGTPTQTNDAVPLAFLDERLQTADANFRGSWRNFEDLPTNPDEYPADYAGSRTPTNNDYCVILDASDFGDPLLYNGTWKFKYTGSWAAMGRSGWMPEYQINEKPLTQSQLDALNSGVTEEKLLDIYIAIENRVPIRFPPTTGGLAAYATLDRPGEPNNPATSVVSIDEDFWPALQRNSQSIPLRTEQGTVRGADAIVSDDLVNLRVLLNTSDGLEGEINAARDIAERNAVRLDNLEQGISPDPISTDASVAYEKIVPPNALPYAEIEKIGGISVRIEGELVDVAPTRLFSTGGNLWRNRGSTVFQGVTFTIEDGVYTLNGTATGTGNLQIDVIKLPAGTYTLCAYKEGTFPSGFNVNAYANSSFSLAIAASAKYDATATGTLTEETSTTLRIRVGTGDVFNNCKIRPMLNRGATAAPFRPRTTEPVGTFEIPASVQALPGYGLGVDGTYNNHIAWDEQGKASFVKMVRKFTYTGSQYEAYYLRTSEIPGGDANPFSLFTIALRYTNDPNEYPPLSSVTPAVINYDIPYEANYNNTSERFYVNENGLVLVLSNDKVILSGETSPSEAGLRAYLEANPLTIVYALRDVETVDISSDITNINFIKEQGGGLIVVENAQSLAVPSTITYLMRGE